jgi:N-acyl-D-amino-acid deacylase
MNDLLIRGGYVIDGSGAPGREADVAVLDGRIAAVEPRSAGPARRMSTSMTDADVHEISRTPWVTVGSDGNALAVTGITGQGKPHPRYYGTHAHVLGPCVRDLRLLTLETAVAKMTGVAARALGLRDRSVLRAGAWADVVVFDPARITDRSTYEEPHRYAAGVSTVLVNGQVTIDGGDHTGAPSGGVLKRPA